MTSRTYLPQLLKVLLVVCKYIARWETQIRASLPEGAPQAALTAVLVACEALRDILETTIPNPT